MYRLCGCFLFVLALTSTARHANANALDHLRTTDDIGLNKIPHVGTSNILVIPSRVGVSEFPPAQWAAMEAFFATEGGPGTFRDYWQKVSGGIYDPIPTLVDPVLYEESCPIPGKDVDSCTFSLNDVPLVFSSGVATIFEDLLGRVRDEQEVDLSAFDINGTTPGVPDGYFDGIIVDTDMYAGIAFPLAAFNNLVTVDVTSNLNLSAGTVALVPPENHEFAHMFGFMDLYGGPTLHGLMSATDATLAAFSRQQIAWSNVETLALNSQSTIAPVLHGGDILRVGSGDQYFLIENRGGALHQELDSGFAGVYVYAVDEAQLPSTAMGFVDTGSGSLYLPNESPPYLNVNLPVGCTLESTNEVDSCAVSNANTVLNLVHPNDSTLAYTLCVDPASDGYFSVALSPADSPQCNTEEVGDPQNPNEPGEKPEESPNPGGEQSFNDNDTEAGCRSHRASSTLMTVIILMFSLRFVVRRRRLSATT